MEDKRGEQAVLVLLFIPVFMAIGGLVTEFNLVDFIYLLLVLMIFIQYYIKTKKLS